MLSKLKSGFSLSPGQQRLWQVAQKEGLQNYFVTVDFKIQTVNEAAICQAFTRLACSHEILRMEFGVLPGMQLPVQAGAEMPLEVTLLTPQLSAINDDFRFSLQKLNHEHYRLGMSAMCADGQTALLILAEVQDLLADPGVLQASTELVCQEEDLPFTSLAQWQHDMLAEPQELQLPSWNESNCLQAGAGLPQWPFLRKKPLAGSYVKRQALTVSAEMNMQLLALAERESVPLAHVLYLAWAVLLYRLHADAPLPAYLASGRAYDEMADALGPLARFIPLPVGLTVDRSFADILKNLSAALKGATDLQDYIVGLPADDRPAAGFSYLQAPATLTHIQIEAPLAWTDNCLIMLTGFMADTGQLELYFDYDMASCDAASMQNLEEELLHLLAAIIDQPAEQIGKLNILGQRERHLLLQEFAGAQVNVDQVWQAPVQEIWSSLISDPDRIVIEDGDMRMNATAFAHRLQQLTTRILTGSAGYHHPVIAVLLERSVDMVASLLAAQLSGAAYLPLDTAYPDERIAFMLQDSGAGLLLTSVDIAENLRQQTGFAALLERIRIVIVDEESAGWTANDAVQRQLPVLRSNDLAYLIYTSGSTGVPKAVAVSHGALANHMRWMLKELPLASDDAVLQKTAISFDASVWEVFAPLMAGARLVLAAPGVERDPEQLLNTLIAQGITVLQLVPSMLRMLVVQPQFAACPRLRRLCCGGEVLDAELASQALDAMPAGAECINLYGPTEATVQVVFERVSRDDEIVAIGKPIDNTRIYILDHYLQLVPIGVRGEMYVAGASLAQGYYQRDALTAERFVSDPFFSDPLSAEPARMYRTGDLGAWRADGRLDCFGRADRQVKLRGYRIELGEIETAVTTQAEVLMAAVVVDRDAAGIDQLLCFYTIRPGHSLSQADLKQRLASALPEYMLPNWLIPLDHLPLMPNGKIDNTALLKLRPSSAAISQAPRDTLEMRLERIWETVLHVSQVGITSNFFELGGHSLLAVRLMAEIEKEFTFRLPLTSLFSAPTIAAQAELLRNQSLQLDPIVIPVRAGDVRHSPIVLVHPTGGSVLCYRDLAGGINTERPVIALQDPGLMGEADYQSVEELATLYLDKIEPLVKDQRYLLAGWSSGGIIAYEMARQALARGYEIAFLCLIDSQVAPASNVPPARDRLLRSISRLIAHKAELACPDFSGLDFDVAMPRLLQLAREADFIPPHADQKEIEKLFRVFEKNVTVIGRYEAGALPRRTLLMKATQALPETIREAAVHYVSEEKNLGWDKLCFVKVREIAGDHMSIMEAPRVSAVIAALDFELKEVERLHGLGRQILMPMLGW